MDTLHAAIKLVLVTAAEPLSPQVIADRINDLQLYQNKDKKLIPADQVLFRAESTPELIVNRGKIHLPEFADRDTMLELYIAQFVRLKLTEIKQWKEFTPSVFLAIMLKKLTPPLKLFKDKNDPYSREPDPLTELLKKNSREDHQKISAFIDNSVKELNQRIDFHTGVSFLKEHTDNPNSELDEDNVKFFRAKPIAILAAKLITASRNYWAHGIGNDNGVGNDRSKFLYHRDLPEVIIQRLKDKVSEFKNKNFHLQLDVVDHLIPVYLLEVLEYSCGAVVYYNPKRREYVSLLQKLFRAASLDIVIKTEVKYSPDSNIGICMGWFSDEPDHYINGITALTEQQKRLEKNAFQLFVGAPSVLRKPKTIALNYQPTAIYTVPYNSVFTQIKSLGIIEFDFLSSTENINDSTISDGESLPVYLSKNQQEVSEIQERGKVAKDKTFIADFSEQTDIDKISSILRNQNEIDGISVNLSFNKLTKSDWTPSRYVHSSLTNPIVDKGTKLLKDLIVEFNHGWHINETKRHSDGNIQYITTTDLEKDTILFEVKKSTQSFYKDSVEGNLRFLKKGAVLISLIGDHLKPSVYNLNLRAITDNNVLSLICSKDILPEYLVLQLNTDYCLKQANALRIKGTTISRILRSDLESIKIKVPSIEKQQKELLRFYEKFKLKQADEHDTDEFNFIATLKHTLKQPLTTLSEDFRVLQSFLNEKSQEGILALGEIIVPVFEGEDKSALVKHSLESTLLRCQRMINDAHDHLNKAEQLLKIDTNKPKFEVLSIKAELMSLEKDFPNIQFDFKGQDYKVNIDRYSFRIMMDNFIENAVKHGFGHVEHPKVSFRTEIEREKYDLEYVCIEYMNNGDPLSEDISTDKFLQKNSKSKKSAGDGYGGHLIDKIIKLHDGMIEIDARTAETEVEYNVCFNIYLPKI